ncbi:MAG: hypothetical protein JEY79_02530 [Pseudodesulfovibrio sp.]|nr:hypothetical protein [Pseudodesulfovibrio sp.]
MRIKIWEWIMSILMIFYGFSMIHTGVYTLYGIPMFPVAAYALTAVGIVIPILAWFFRSPARKPENDK